MPRIVANVALNKPTRQSSVHADPQGLPPGAQASGGANNGLRTGLFGFHTAPEPAPWWIVDLQAQYRLFQVRIYNRTDTEDAARQAGDLDIFVSSDGVFWIKAFSRQEAGPFGLDGMPLVVPISQALPLRYIKLQRRGTGCLHLDEVEVYGERVGAAQSREAPVLPPLPDSSAPTPAEQPAPPRRVIHVKPRAGLANRMLMYMAGASLWDLVPDAQLSSPGLPEWHVPQDTIEPNPGETTFTVARPEDFRMAEIALKMKTGGLTYLVIEDYLQNLQYYPDPERFRGVFRPLPQEVEDLPTFAPDEIVLNVRSAEILDGAMQYPLVPAGFYRSIVERTGLKPVLLGQLDPSFYVDTVLQAVPGARIIESQGPIRDFQMLRSARHIVVAVSTFSWLAAWLSHAETIHLPVLGFYQPHMIRPIDLLPLQDPRYRFYLLPHIYGVAEREALHCHRRLRDDDWPLVPPDQLAFIAKHQPFVPSGSHPGDEVDSTWYSNEYLEAAREIAQGWYADPRHHFRAVGKQRGYLSHRPPGYGAVAVDDWPTHLPNIALGCPATQSSVCAASVGATPQADAALAVNGVIAEPFAFHTSLEDRPWWQVDLQAPYRIVGVRIYNRHDSDPARQQAMPMAIWLSDDGEAWRMAFRGRTTEPFWDRDGQPFEWRPDAGTVARFLRIQIMAHRSLHLRQVEVYGLPVQQPVPDADQ